MNSTANPADYLLRTSSAGLESFQLSQMSRSANLRKELLQVVNEIVKAEAKARAACWLRDRRSNEGLRGEEDRFAFEEGDSPAANERNRSSLFLPADVLSSGMLLDEKPRMLPASSLSNSAASDSEVSTVKPREGTAPVDRVPSARDASQLELFSLPALAESRHAPTVAPAVASQSWVKSPLLVASEGPGGAIARGAGPHSGLAPVPDPFTPRLARCARLIRSSLASRSSRPDSAEIPGLTNVVEFPPRRRMAHNSRSQCGVVALKSRDGRTRVGAASRYGRARRRNRSSLFKPTPFELVASHFPATPSHGVSFGARAGARRA